MCIALHSPIKTAAQTVDFETKDYAGIGVYDGCETSPFRSGTLKGHAEVIGNFLNQPDSATGFVPNPSSKILAVQRSRHGSNTFGVRIDLENTFELTPRMRYIHVMIHKPVAGRVMLIGLGKRRERAEQSPRAEQCWAFSMDEVQPNRWNDAVFAVKGAGGIDIHSLVIVPDAEQPGAVDFAAYIDHIVVSDSPKPFILSDKSTTDDARALGVGDTISVSQFSRNGDVLAADGSPLAAKRYAFGQPVTVRMRPANGFSYSGIRVRHGRNLTGEATVDGQTQWTETVFKKNQFGSDDTFTIPSEYIDGDLLIEGLFVEIRK